TSIEAPPSLLPQKHYCDITGLESASSVKEYLAARGINSIVKCSLSKSVFYQNVYALL
ncbi:hypothetical protein B0H16DRAFT_1609372, partial [Mycena metata]